MFSNHLPKIDSVPRDYFFVGGGLFLIVALLLVFATVAEGAMEKAQRRDSLQASQRSAVAYCVETLRGVALNNCVHQAKADNYGIDTSMVVGNSAGFSRAVGGSKPGFMPAGFSLHQ